jgi:hypothetical protein
MHAKGSAPMAPSPSPTTSPNTPAPKSFPKSAKRPSCSRALRRWPASAAPPTPSATSAVSREVLHRGRQLGHGRQQHAGVLPARPAQVPGSQPCGEARPAHQPAQRQEQLGFLDLAAEALHQITIVMSDRGIPATYRHMHGFGSHTFSFINAQNERFWVKFHFKSQQGIQNLTDAEAEALIGKDRESHQRDLYESIEKGDFPKWTLKVQIMPEAGCRQSSLQSVST